VISAVSIKGRGEIKGYREEGIGKAMKVDVKNLSLNTLLGEVY